MVGLRYVPCLLSTRVLTPPNHQIQKVLMLWNHYFQQIIAKEMELNNHACAEIHAILHGMHQSRVRVISPVNLCAG
jgi:hypothetical protein